MNTIKKLLLSKRAIPFLYLAVSLYSFNLQSQTPVLKVDLNIGSRKESEVNEPGYTAWPIYGGADSMTLDSVKITFKNGGIGAGWYKTGVQSPYYARLVNDGISTSKVEMHISGLQSGRHTLVTFHNTFDNPETNTFSPMDVYLNDSLVIDDLELTNRILSNDDATTVFIEFEVINNETIILRFQSDPSSDTINDKITICGFHLNSSDPKKMVKYQYPSDKDKHVNIDNDTLTLYWQSPANTVSHDIYLGVNEEDVLLADTISSLFLGNQPDTFFTMSDFSAVNTYYWRVDPIHTNGEKTRGDVLSFKKRIRSFEGAEGYGGYAIGGRGGKLVFVTNLNNDGPGSFREAVTCGIGPRTVIFNVSGIITLNDKIFCDPDVTIAGQTAPGKGICFRKSSLAVSSESICRFVRMRLGSGESTDGMGIPGAAETILDHCSVSWSIDEGVTSRNAKNITIQKTLVSEALNMANLHDDPTIRHSFAAVVGGDIGSFHHNLLAHNSGRNPRFDGGMDGDNYYTGRVDCFNNIVYNWNAHSAYGEAHEVNFVNNYYKQGPATDKTLIFNADVNQRETNLGTESYYTSGNVLELKNNSFQCDGSVSDCGIISTIHGTMVIDWDIFVSGPFFPSDAKIETAHEAYKSVLSDVGCTMPAFDDHDKRMISETMTGTYTYTGSKTGLSGIIDSETDAGGYENYPALIRPEDFDNDNDGLPTWWEELHGSNPNSAEGDLSDANADPDSNGYTVLEDYLEWMSVPHYYLEENASDTIDLLIFTAGYTNNPTYTEIGSKDDISVVFNGSNAIITPQSGAEGICYIYFMVTDAEGATMKRKLGFCIGATEPESIVSARDIEAKKEIQCKVYPTIFKNSINIETKVETFKLIDVSLYNIDGKAMLKNTFGLKAGFNRLRLDCQENIPNKMYILKITDLNTGEIIKIEKVFKK